MPELVALMHSMIGLAAVFIAIACVAEPWAFHIVDKGQPIPYGNRIELFEGFAEPALPMGAVANGSWTFANGQAVAATSPPSQGAYALVWPKPMTASNTVLAQFTLVTPGGDGTQPIGTGVMTQLDFATGRGAVCWIYTVPGASGSLQLFESPTINGPTTPIGGLDPTKRYRLDLTRRTNQYTCRELAMYGAPVSASYPLQTAQAMVGLMSQAYEARFDWILVVTRPQ